jgi:hypothetical protein
MQFRGSSGSMRPECLEARKKHGIPGPGTNARRGTDPSGISQSRGAVWKLHLSIGTLITFGIHVLTSEADGPSIFPCPLDNVLGGSDRPQCIRERRDLIMRGQTYLAKRTW